MNLSDQLYDQVTVANQQFDKGQMELYLKWLDKHERQAGKKHPSAWSCAPKAAANRWSCCRCTKTASPWPNTGPNCHPKRSWSKSCMQHCLKRVSGWRGVGCCWGIWMMSDKTLPRPVAMLRIPGDPWEFRLPTLCKPVFLGWFGVRYLAAGGWNVYPWLDIKRVEFY